jgi:hypothetical protein
LLPEVVNNEDGEREAASATAERGSSIAED